MAVPQTQAEFDENFYLLHSPDIAELLRAGTEWLPSGWSHFEAVVLRRINEGAAVEDRLWRNAVTGEEGHGTTIIKTSTPQTPVLTEPTPTTTTTPTPTGVVPATTFQGITSLPIVGPIVVQIGNAAIGFPVVGGLVNSIALATGAHPGTIVIGAAALLYFVVLPMVMNQSRGRRR